MGDDSFNKTLSKILYVISNPRLNICLFGHASEFIQHMKEEKPSKDDCLIQRIMCSAPMPQFDEFKIVEDARNFIKTFLMSVFLHVIHRYYNRFIDEVRTNSVYSFITDAKLACKDYYTDYKKLSKKMNNIDNFIVLVFKFSKNYSQI
jgi:hypothetical protein